MNPFFPIFCALAALLLGWASALFINYLLKRSDKQNEDHRKAEQAKIAAADAIGIPSDIIPQKEWQCKDCGNKYGFCICFEKMYEEAALPTWISEEAEQEFDDAFDDDGEYPKHKNHNTNKDDYTRRHALDIDLGHVKPYEQTQKNINGGSLTL